MSLTKPQALTRAGGSASARSAKGKAGFASVLESIQQDDQPLDASRTRQAPAARGEREHDVQPDARRDRVSPAGDAERAADVPTTPATQQTPWLLLALGSGLRAWQDSPASDEAGNDAIAVGDAAQDGAADALAAGAAASAGLPIIPNPVVTIAVDAAPTGPVTAVDVTVAEAAGTETSSIGDGGPAVLQPPFEDVPSGPETLGPEVVAARKAQSAEPSAKTAEAAAVAPVSGADVTPTAGPAIHTVSAGAADEKQPTAAAEKPTIDPQAHAARQARPSARAAAWLGQQMGAVQAGGSDVEASVTATQQQTSLIDAAAAGVRESLPLDERPSVGRGQARRGPQDGLAPAAPPQMPQTLSALPETASVAQTMALPDAVGEQVLDQVVTSVRLQWKDGIGEARLQLRPDSLGTVTVALKVEAGAVTAVVRAESADVQEWVVKHQDSLRQQMEAAGLNLAELVVSPDDRGQGKEQAPQQQRRPRPAVMATQTRRFEELL